MVKVKNKKRNLAEHTSNKKKMTNAKKLNPFEIHINREKMRVIGKKSKTDRGLPGIQRSKALKKRQHTLLQEYRVLNKANRFTDKRIGEHNHHMTDEDRLTARFTAERVKVHKKRSIFNLADDEELTHRGQTLNEIEKFDDPRSDDEDSVDGRAGNLHKDFVGDVHFGGGILKRGEQDPVKTHKELIDQLIIESKKRKAEKQKTREETLELTEKLDTEWKDLIPIITQSAKTKEDANENKDASDAYDKAVKELKFEARGTPSDRLKTEDEIARAEREKLEQLERDRVERMHGFIKANAGAVKHRSADDLDDNFAYDSEPEEAIAYNEKGELIGKQPETNKDVATEEVEAGDDGENNSDDNEADDGEEEDDEVEDNLSDLKEDSSESEAEEEQIQKSKFQQTEEPIQVNDSIKSDLLQRKEIMEKAREELPFTFEMPNTYEDLQSLLKNQTPNQQTIIIERIIKCNHPSLAEDNKEKLSMLFVYLLQYISDLAADLPLVEAFNVTPCIYPQMFDLAQLNSLNAHNCVLEVIKEKQQEYRKRPKTYPNYDVLFYCKLIGCLFSTSDFQHKVTIPTVVFIDQMLQRCKVRTKRDISYGLFLVTLILEYTVLSKRFLPAAINFLTGIFYMALPKSIKPTQKIVPPFRANLRLLSLDRSNLRVKDLKLNVSDLEDGAIDDEYKLRVIFTSLCLLQEFHANLRQNPSSREIFQSVLNYLNQLPKDYLRGKVQKKLEEVVGDLTNANNKSIPFIVMEKKRPKALRLYEPNIQKVYDEKRHRVMSKQKAEISKLQHKLKMEKKGAIREIRRDNSFLSGVKIKQKIQSDRERREKVKRIYGEASTQQSELNSFDRQKKRKK